MYQIHPGDTIKYTLDKIFRHDLVLPAIQREFVWRPEQICRLFDSLMQGYPFGTFLYWRVDRENSDKFKFYDFVREYHQRDNPHCPPLPAMPYQQLTAVLDGQQRLTALNIGLRGSMAWKLPRLRWNSDYAFPKRRLYLDLLWDPDEDEGQKYYFEFLTDKEVKQVKDKKCWFPVSKMLKMPEAHEVSNWVKNRLSLSSQEQMGNRILHQLHRVVHIHHLVAYYEEMGQELDKVLQIFIRMNDGGTPLSHSDMLLSIAVAQWTHFDAREEIHTRVDELNRIGIGFSFSKDWVLKAGLMLSDIGSVGFKVDNFNRENMDIFENKWEGIKRALTMTVELISSFGFSGQNLSASNAILPVAYYLYNKNPGEAYLTHSQFKQDRQAIREWLIRSLLKSGVWGSGLDTLLTALRRVIRESNKDSFPVTKIYEEMARRGRSLVFEEEELEDLADMRYGDKRTFALLSLVFPFVNLRNQLHIDHIFPVSRFTKPRLEVAGVPDNKIDDFIQRKDGLANLQLLEGPENVEKRAKLPAEWLSQTYSDSTSRQNYVSNHMLGDVPETITEFDTFYEARRACLKAKLEKLLGR